MKLKRAKASYVMQDGVAFEEKHSIASIFQKQYFSLLIDESTDVSVSQVLAIVVRFLSRFCGPRCFAWSRRRNCRRLVQSSEETAKWQKKIPLTSLVGFAADNCATMMGSASGFQAQLKAHLPDVFGVSLLSRVCQPCVPVMLVTSSRHGWRSFSKTCVPILHLVLNELETLHWYRKPWK